MHTIDISNIRSDQPRAADKIVGFLANNQDDGVALRPRDELDKATASGFGIKLQVDGETCGVSLVYGYEESLDTNTLFSEIGTMRITLNGLGLQEFVAMMHIVQLQLEDYYYDGARWIFAVVEPDTASAHIMGAKVGMELWSPPKELIRLRTDCGVPFNANKIAVVASSSVISSAFAGLKALHIGEDLFNTPKGDARIRVRGLRWFTPELLD